MGIIGFLNLPTTEHFFIVALPLRIQVASAWSVTTDRIYITSIRFSAELGAEQTPSAPIGWLSLVRMDTPRSLADLQGHLVITSAKISFEQRGTTAKA